MATVPVGVGEGRAMTLASYGYPFEHIEDIRPEFLEYLQRTSSVKHAGVILDDESISILAHFGSTALEAHRSKSDAAEAVKVANDAKSKPATKKAPAKRVSAVKKPRAR